MLNHSSTSFGETRKFNGKVYELAAKFDMIDQKSKDRFNQTQKELKLENQSVRTVTNTYREKALYVFSNN